MVGKKKKHWTHLNKLEKHKALYTNPTIRRHLPDTIIYQPQRLIEYLNKYLVLYLKPYDGTGGHGIIRIKKVNQHFIIQYDQQKREYSNLQEIIGVINSIIKKRIYLIQQGIDLISINDRPIDFRLLILKPSQNWNVVGIRGKLAAKNKIVTNRSRGGEPITFKNALGSTLGYSDMEIADAEQKLSELSLLIANTLEKHFRYVREIGIDIAIDTKGRPWILETNSLPRYHLFADDPILYERIDQEIKYIRRNYLRKKV